MRSPITSLPALACFRVAAELESFSQAASRLNLTHGAISRAVRLIEADLGEALFERRNRRVFLTSAGRDLARAVEEGLGRIEATAHDIRAARANRPVTLSCEPTLLMRWLIPRLPEFHAAHPDLQIQVVAGGGPVVLGAGIDLAIRRGDFQWPGHYHAEHLFDEAIGPVCRPDLAARMAPGGAGLVPLHTRTRADAWETWRRLDGRGMGEGEGRIFDHFYFSLQAAVAGLGAAIGSFHMVRDDMVGGLLAAPFGFVGDGTSYQLLSARPLTAFPAAAALCDWLRQVGA